MSYDLMVFETTTAPATKQEFMVWYDKQTEWSEEHDYITPSVTSPNLHAWFAEMRKTFPPMNGEGAPDIDSLNENEDLERHITDYAIGKEVIYAAFSWSLVDEAYKLTRELAKKHKVGFFDASGDGDIILPDGTMIT